MRVGIDIGYSSVKIAYGSATDPTCVLLRTGASPLADAGFGIDGLVSQLNGQVVMLDGEPWIAGVDPSRLPNYVPMLDEGYIETKEYKALFLAALARIGQHHINCLVTGLPVNHYKRPEMRAKLEQLMIGEHVINEDLIVTVDKVRVVAQPAGAFAAHTMDLVAGRSTSPIREGTTVLVADPGHYSMDWILFHGSFNMDSSGSTSNAGEMVIRRAAVILSEKSSVLVRPTRLQEAVLNGDTHLPIPQRGQTYNIAEVLQQAATEVVRQNLRTLRASIRVISDRQGVDLVLVTGGGASLFRPALAEAFPEAEIASIYEPILANARGFLAIAARS